MKSRYAAYRQRHKDYTKELEIKLKEAEAKILQQYHEINELKDKVYYLETNWKPRR